MYTFDEIYGNENLKKNLQNSIVSDRMPHAIIFEGEKGIGKKLLANTLAKTLQCQEKKANPCNVCSSCIAFDNNNHTEVYYVKPTKTIALGVNDIREQITNKIDIAPFSYPYKIFIIDNAHNMTPQAQNALLKTIEEPPFFGKFFFLAENDTNFLKTVLSRCVLFKMKPLNNDILYRYGTSNLSLEDEYLKAYVVFSKGNIGTLRELALDSDFVQIREKILSFPKLIEKKPVSYIFIVLRELEQLKDHIYEILDIWQLWYRDLAILQRTSNLNLISQQDKVNVLQSDISSYSFARLLKNCEAIEHTKNKLNSNGNFLALICSLLLKLKE